MRSLFLLLAILCLGNTASAQKKLHSKSKKAIDLYNQAYELDSVGNIFQSLPLLQDAIFKDDSFDEAYLLLFITYMKRNEIGKALQTIEQSRPKVEEKFTNRMSLELATFYWSNGKYESAIKIKEGIGEEVEAVDSFTIQLVSQSIDFAFEGKKNPLKVDFQELKNPMNLFEAQYFPSLASDGTLIFTGRKKGRRGTGENLYLSKLNKGKWDVPVSLSDNINTARFNEGTASIASDGFSIVFTGCNRPKGLGSCDLYISYYKNEAWSKPENLGQKVNTKYWESQPSLSQDGRQLYFVSKRPGGLGGEDIWISYKINGQWTSAINAGPIINTRLDDGSPFIYPDGKTFYYASRGKLGFGGFDLFKTEITQHGWAKPVNLGYPINTFDNQVGYALGLDGWAYYSDNNLMQQTKLYRFKMPKSLMPSTSIKSFSGIVQDAKTKQSISSELYVMDLSKDSVIVETHSKSNGLFGFIASVLNDDYMVYANKNGYKLFKKRLSKISKEGGMLILEMEVLAVGEKVILNNVLFELNSATLDLKAKKELLVARTFLEDNPKIEIEIGGHTDITGEADYNLKLSKDRAKAVLDFFVEHGIDLSRLTYAGFGESKPISNTIGAEANALNRRIELVIIGI